MRSHPKHPRLVLLAAGSLLFSACGTEVVDSNSGSSNEQVTRIGCEFGPYFPTSTLDDAPPLVADSQVPEVLDAAAVFLDSGEGDFWPQDGWRVLSAKDQETVLLVHAGSDDEPALAFMNFEWDENGWQWSGASMPGDCDLVSEGDPDSSTVEWVLDPDDGPLTAETTTFGVLATEQACASGQPMGGRLNPPMVTATESAILLSLTAQPLQGAQNCPGNPSQRVEIVLAEPIGSRTVVDARSTGLGDLGTLLRASITASDADSSDAFSPTDDQADLAVGETRTR